MKHICLECGKRFELHRRQDPVCPAPRCRSSAVEPDYEQIFPSTDIHRVRVSGLEGRRH